MRRADVIVVLSHAYVGYHVTPLYIECSCRLSFVGELVNCLNKKSLPQYGNGRGTTDEERDMQTD